MKTEELNAAKEKIARIDPAVLKMLGFERKYDLTAASLYPVHLFTAKVEEQMYRMELRANPGLRSIIHTHNYPKFSTVDLLLDIEFEAQDEFVQALAKCGYKPAIQYVRASRIDKFLM